MITNAHPMIDYPILPVLGLAVALEDGFWRPRLETNRRITIPAILDKCERSGRVDNFRRAAGRGRTRERCLSRTPMSTRRSRALPGIPSSKHSWTG